MMRSRPTMYRGVQMRSRLEATWASFFDGSGWEWEYEPAIDAPGWIPDFLLGRRVLVEVKPIHDIADAAEVRRYTRKVVGHSGAARPILVLGLNPVPDREGRGRVIGALLTEGALTPLIYCHPRKRPDDFDLVNPDEGWRMAIGGDYGGWTAADSFPLWAAAKNDTQWRPPSR